MASALAIIMWSRKMDVPYRGTVETAENAHRHIPGNILREIESRPQRVVHAMRVVLSVGGPTTTGGCGCGCGSHSYSGSRSSNNMNNRNAKGPRHWQKASPPARAYLARLGVQSNQIKSAPFPSKPSSTSHSLEFSFPPWKFFSCTHRRRTVA